MAFSRIYSGQNYLLKAHLVSVEIDLSRGLHAFSIVGLPNKAVEESRDRVSAAIKNCGFKSPKQTNSKITVSLAPANLKKEGPAFDLPIAIGYMIATGSISFNPNDKLFVGELSLDGTVRSIRGALSFAELALKNGISELYVPKDNAAEAALIKEIKVFGVSNLTELLEHLSCGTKLKQERWMEHHAKDSPTTTGLDDVAGQQTAKRGLIIAAAGGHNIGLFGPPGTGKTLLARALQGILPKLSLEESLEVTGIYSAAGHLQNGIMSHPPIRSPHHTSPHTALVGGGVPPKPGEATLAHKGILFLDEFPEFDRRSIEALRQPVEDGSISISRIGGISRFPAKFILIIALNPCPCGNKGIKGKRCVCTAKDVARYSRKLSGPIIDRIDMWIEVSAVDYKALLTRKQSGDETKEASLQVLRAREVQAKRLSTSGLKLNSDISVRNNTELLKLSKEGEEILNKAALSHDLSGRGYHRVIKLARTIADIEESENIEAPHIYEALQYRKKN